MENNRKGSIPDEVKYEIARDMGIYETIKRDGSWANVTSRDCGNIVKKTLERSPYYKQ
ncbi:MAG: small, acid-soluble spore protein, alpha/beta type [Bacillota bacterium]